MTDGRDTSQTQFVPDNSLSALQIRLDVEPVHQKMQISLSGKMPIAVQKEDGSIITDIQKTGEPMVNDRGVQGIMSMAVSILNPQNVQGNLDQQQIYDMMYDAVEEISSALLYNKAEWFVKPNLRSTIVGNLERIGFTNLSRTKENLERVSYGQSVKLQESTVFGKNRMNIPLYGQK